MGGILGGSSGSKTQQVVNKNEPPAYLEPYLTDLSGKAQGAYNQFINRGFNQPYTGARSAGRNPFDDLAIGTSLNAGSTFRNQGVPQNTYDLGQFFQNKVKSGAYQTPGNMAFNVGDNTALQGAIDANIRPVLENFNETLVPQLKSAAIESGAYGGSKFNETGERLARDTQRNLGDIAANLTYQDFMQKRELGQQDLAQRRQLLQQGNLLEGQGANTATSLFNLGLGQDLQMADIFSNVADRERGFEQQDINDAIALFDESRLSPFMGLGDYAALVNGVAGSAGGTQTQSKYGYQQPGSSFLSGLGTLAAINPFQTGGGMFGSLFGGGSLGLEALFNGLPWSDRRLKENIKKVGAYKGLGVYMYNYIWDKTRTWVGLMAQEVFHKVPAAIGFDSGYLTIDYRRV